MKIKFSFIYLFFKISKLLLHSDAKNRWFDKQVQLIVFENGKAGFNFEVQFFFFFSFNFLSLNLYLFLNFFFSNYIAWKNRWINNG